MVESCDKTKRPYAILAIFFEVDDCAPAPNPFIEALNLRECSFNSCKCKINLDLNAVLES